MTIEGEMARDLAVNFECKKDALRQNQDGSWKLTVNIHPDEFPPSLTMNAMGQRYVCALVAIDDNEQPLDRAVVPQHSKHQDESTNSPDTLKALSSFHAWLKDSEYTKEQIYAEAGVESLSGKDITHPDWDAVRQVWKRKHVGL